MLINDELDFEKVLHKKEKRRELPMQLDLGNVNHCFIRAVISKNSITDTGLDNISAFFGNGKWKAVELLQPMEGASELWPVSRERVISIPGELLIQDPEAPVGEMYRSKWHTVDVLATRSTPSLSGRKVKLENLPPCESSFRLYRSNYIKPQCEEEQLFCSPRLDVE